MTRSPSLKARLDRLLTPLFSLMLGFFLLAPIASGLLFSRAEAPTEGSEESGREALEAARAEAEKAGNAEEAAYYGAALDLDLDPWNQEFDSVGASLYGTLSLHLEAEERNEALPRLRAILEKRDEEALLSFYREYLSEHSSLDPEEIEEDLFAVSLRFLATRDGKINAGESLLISHMRTIRKSLAEKKDLFHPVNAGAPLSEKEEKQLAALSDFYRGVLDRGEAPAIPSNVETLFLLESLLSFLTLVALFLLFFFEKASCDSPALLLLRFFALLFLLTIGLFCSTLLFASDLTGAVPVPFGSGILSLPFFLALLGRVLCRGVGNLLLFSLFLLLFSRKKRRALKGAATLLFALVYSSVSYLFRLFGANSALLPYLPFVHTDSVQNLFPSLPMVLPQSPVPLLSFLILCALTGVCLFCHYHKKRPES